MNFRIKTWWSDAGLKTGPLDVPRQDNTEDDGPAEGPHCRKCGYVPPPTLSLRHCPRCATPKAEEEPPKQEKTTHCPECGYRLPETIPLRRCPRCATRQPGYHPDPDEEPLEAIEEKIKQRQFTHSLARSFWVGWSVGTLLSLLPAVLTDLGWVPDFGILGQGLSLPSRRWLRVAVWVFLGGWLGGAFAILFPTLIRPIWITLFNSNHANQRTDRIKPRSPADSEDIQR